MKDTITHFGIKAGLINEDKILSPTTDKDKRLSLIVDKASWLKEDSFLLNSIVNVRGKKLTSTVEGIKELENLTLGQIRMIHDDTIRRRYNSNPIHIESNDVMKYSAGGLMWGGLFRSRGHNYGWQDIETGATYNKNQEGALHAKFHLLPLGVTEHIPSLARQSARIIAIDMPRLMDNIFSNTSARGPFKIDAMHADLNLNAARFLHTNYGFRIHAIWTGSHALTTFPGWTELSKQQEVVVRMFVMAEDFGIVWDKSLDYLEKITPQTPKLNRAEYSQFEINLRKLAIAVGSTKEEIINSPQLADWWKIYKPDFIGR